MVAVLCFKLVSFFLFVFLSKFSLTSESWVGLVLLTEPDLERVHVSVRVRVSMVETGR